MYGDSFKKLKLKRTFIESAHRSGCVVCAYYLIANLESAPPPSIGFPGYVYPNKEICDLYEGVPCDNVVDACCYNAAKYCTDPTDPATCSLIDNGAYPIGDLPVFNDQMHNVQALTPFPNAIYYNWVTLIVLAFGNLAALDFQVSSCSLSLLLFSSFFSKLQIMRIIYLIIINSTHGYFNSTSSNIINKSPVVRYNHHRLGTIH